MRDEKLKYFFFRGEGGIDIILCKVQSTGLTHPRTISNQAPCSREVEKKGPFFNTLLLRQPVEENNYHRR